MVRTSLNDIGISISNLVPVSNDSDLEPRASAQVQSRANLSALEKTDSGKQRTLVTIQARQLSGASFEGRSLFQALHSTLKLWAQGKLWTANQAELLRLLLKRYQQQWLGQGLAVVSQDCMHSVLIKPWRRKDGKP